MTLDENIAIPIPCPDCGKPVQQTLRGLRDNQRLTCPACNTVFSFSKPELENFFRIIEDVRKRNPGRQ